MSRSYNVSILVTNHNKDRESAIADALEEQLGLDEEFETYAPEKGPEQFTLGQDTNLCGGESEEEYSERVARIIFDANEDYCDISVGMTFLDNPPYEEYNFSQKEYDLWRGYL